MWTVCFGICVSRKKKNQKFASSRGSQSMEASVSSVSRGRSSRVPSSSSVQPVRRSMPSSETQAAEECLSRLDVPAEWEIPDGDCRYDCIIKDNCEMLLFWHTPDRRLYIVQNLV